MNKHNHNNQTERGTSDAHYPALRRTHADGVSDNDRGQPRPRDRDDRNQNPDEFSTYGRPANKNFNADSFSRNQGR